MQVGVLTYTGRHRKTYDTLCRLKTKGYHNVNVYAVPYSYKKTFRPLYEHRPYTGVELLETEDVCKAFGYDYNTGRGVRGIFHKKR